MHRTHLSEKVEELMEITIYSSFQYNKHVTTKYVGKKLSK